MSFCSNCGAKIREGDSFCTSCGTKVQKIDLGESDGNETAVRTCPMCGEAIPPLKGVCPACGYELSTSSESSQAEKFASKIEALLSRARADETSLDKAQSLYVEVAHMIRDCPVDDDKAAMVDFVMLAERSVDNVLSVSGKKGVAARETLLPAWQLRSSQVCKRARLLYGDAFAEMLESSNGSLQERASSEAKRAKTMSLLLGINPGTTITGRILAVVRHLTILIVGAVLLTYGALACVSGRIDSSTSAAYELPGMLLVIFGTLAQFGMNSGLLEVAASAGIALLLLRLADYASLGSNASAIYLAAYACIFNCFLLLFAKTFASCFPEREKKEPNDGK
jgi:predicted nucleic acid-binding Zn ribbon protein